ncbi:MAG: hypothetical protein RL311_12 [Bacteroidota bacterium]|jgi:hypothetical protein
MLKIEEIPILVLMTFTLVYLSIGDPESEIWSGWFFFTNYLTMLLLFRNNRSKKVSIVGMSLSVSVLVFIVLRYFFKIEIERYYTLIPFAICIFGIFKLERK